MGNRLLRFLITKILLCRRNEKKVISIMSRLFFKDLTKVYNSYPYQLSGGMKQRLLAAIALCSDPELLIADEPTKGLDPDSMDKICELFMHIKADHKRTMLIITHDLDFALRICDRIAVMYSGEIVEVNRVKKRLLILLHTHTHRDLSVPFLAMDLYLSQGRAQAEYSCRQDVSLASDVDLILLHVLVSIPF